METPDQSQAGYPEEAPAGAVPAGGDSAPSEDSPQRQGGKQPGATDEPGEDGKATGNRRSAG